MRLRLFFCLVPLVTTVVAGVAPPRVARADEDTDTKQARRRFQEGVRSFDAKKYEEARVAFLQALALKPHSSIVLNLAACEAAMKSWKDAAGHYEQYLTMPETTDVGRAEAEKGLAEAKRQLAGAEPPKPETSAAPAASAAPPPPPPTGDGVLILRSGKDGTQFQIAAGAKPPPGTIGVSQPMRPLCVAPCEANVPPGELEVLSDGPGQVGGSRKIMLSAGERRIVTVQPGSSAMRLGGWVLVGLGSLGTVVSLLGKGNNAPLTAGSIVAGLGGGGLVFFSRSEMKDAPAPPKAAFGVKVGGSF